MKWMHVLRDTLSSGKWRSVGVSMLHEQATTRFDKDIAFQHLMQPIIPGVDPSICMSQTTPYETDDGETGGMLGC
jgi:hypothetical protein